MKFLTDFHARDILKGGAQALTLKVIATAVGFMVSVTLGRFYGPEGMGVYALMLSTIMILTTISTVGLDNAVIKYVSADLATDNINGASRTLKTALLMVFILATIFATIVWITRDFIAGHLLGNILVAPLLGIAAAGIIFISITRVSSAALKSLGNIPAAYVADGIALPCGILAVFLLTTGNSVERAAFAFLSGATLAILISLIALFTSVIKRQLTNAKSSRKTVNRLWKMSWPTLGIVLGASVTELASMISLSHFSTIDDVGKFRVAWQIAFLMSFLTMATDSVMSPKISALYAKKETFTLAKILRFNIFLLALFSIPAAFILIAFSPYIFSIFGEGFQGAVPFLMILVIGQIINGTLGTAGKVLIMTGHERKSLINSIAGVFIISSLCLFLVPKYGGEGAAMAVVITMAVRCISAVILVRIYLGINMLTGKAYAIEKVSHD